MANTRKTEQQPKPGPKFRTGRPAAVRITVRFDDREIARLRKAAGGRSLSELIRTRALGERAA